MRRCFTAARWSGPSSDGKRSGRAPLGHRSLLAHISDAPKLLPQVPFGGAERAAVPARDMRGGFRWFVPQAALDFPGIAHVDGTARVQTCAQHDNPWLHALLVAVEALGGACVLANSSFNTRGRPLLNRFREALQLLDESDDLA